MSNHRSVRRCCVLLVALAGCQARTELILGIATDIHATQDLDNVQLVVSVNGVPLISAPFTISGQAGIPDNLPGSYGVYSDGNDTSLDIVVTGNKGATTLVTRHATISLVGGQTLFYRLGIASQCMTMGCPDPMQTCVEGTCQDLNLDATQFPAFSDDLVSTLTCESATHYIDTANNNQAMTVSADAPNCGAGLCHEGTCLNPPQAPQGCSLAQAEAGCTASHGACVTACGDVQCTNEFGGNNDCTAPADTPEACIVAACALFQCTSSPAAWMCSVDGSDAVPTAACDSQFQGLASACGTTSTLDAGVPQVDAGG